MHHSSIVLAAGRGRRLGGPKALLAWPSRQGAVPLAVAQVEARRHAGPVWVVVRSAVAERLRRLPAWSASGGQLVLSERDEGLGPAGSLAAAATAAPHEGVVLVTPVDCPPVSSAVDERLVAAVGRPGVRAARPVFEGRGGHPVVLRGALLSRFQRADPPTLRDVLRGLGAGLVDVAVDDPAVRADIDTPDDWARWSRSHPEVGAEPRFF